MFFFLISQAETEPMETRNRVEWTTWTLIQSQGWAEEGAATLLNLGMESVHILFNFEDWTFWFTI